MKISILLCTHRWGGCDMIFAGLEHQTFDKNKYELVWSDKLYKERKDLVWVWAKENGINVIHFPPKNNSNYHVHSSVLNECLNKASGESCIVIGDYTYMLPHWMEIHYAYHQAGYCLSSPQRIYGLPKLSSNLEHPISVFYNDFDPDMFKLLPQFMLDPKIQLPNGTLIDFHYWYNRNESFKRLDALKIGGWDENYNNRAGQSNLEFGLRLQCEANCKIISDGRAEIHRIMSYPIPPFTEFLSEEMDINISRYNKLCDKYGVKP